MRRAARGATIALLACLVLASACRESGPPARPPEGQVEIRGKQVAVEIADSRAEQEKGLGERDGLAWGTDLLFDVVQRFCT